MSKNQYIDFAEEYDYVVQDLKRFGITALAMFALLLLLALIL